MAKAETPKAKTLPPNLCDAAKAKAKAEADSNMEVLFYHNSFTAKAGRFDSCSEYGAYMTRIALMELYSNKDNKLLIQQETAGTLSSTGRTLLKERLFAIERDTNDRYAKDAVKLGCSTSVEMFISLRELGKAPQIGVARNEASFQIDLSNSESKDMVSLAKEVKHSIGVRLTRSDCIKTDDCEQASNLKYSMVKYWEIPEACVYPAQYSGSALATQLKKQVKNGEAVGTASASSQTTAVVAK